MKNDILKQLVENTFSKLANPMQGCGVYAEIEKAMMAAYDMGRGSTMHADTHMGQQQVAVPQTH